MRWLVVLACLAGCQRHGGDDFPPAHNPRAVEEPVRAPKLHTVAIRGMKFEPAQLDVARGDSVTWSNEDIVPHTATAGDQRFDSGMIAAGATYKWLADGPGTHAYTCTVHPSMQGTLTMH